jgi:hypothetical protein
MSARSGKKVPLASTPFVDAAETGYISPTTPVYASPAVPVVTPISPVYTTSALTSPNALAMTPRNNLLIPNSPRSTVAKVNVENVGPIYTPGIDIETINQKEEEEKAVNVELYVDGKPSLDQAAENQLMQLGYTPIQKINMDSRNGKHARYIKAYNMLGEVLLIELNTDDIVVESMKDLTMIKSRNGVSLPYSGRMLMSECSKLEGCAISWQCTDGMCIMENADNGDIVENNYEFVKKFTEQEVVIDNEPVAVPVLHMSDILANPGLTLRTTRKMTHKLRNNAYNYESQQLKMFKDKLAAVQKNFNTFLGIRARDEDRLMKSIATFESYVGGYEKKKLECKGRLLDAVFLQREKECTANLKLRSDKFNEFLRVIRSVARLESALDTINQDLIAAITFLDTEFKFIDKAYEL